MPGEDRAGTPVRAPLSNTVALRDWEFGADTDTTLRPVRLPHVVAALSWRRWDPSSWERRWRYRTNVEVTPDPEARHFLRCHGALTGSTVLVNGRALDGHLGGYLPFTREVTGLLGSSNTVEVLVDGRFLPDVPPNHGAGSPSSAVDFWQPAGLYREVEWITEPADHVSDVFAKPVHVLSSARRVDLHCTLDIGRTGTGLRLSAELRDGDQVLDRTASHLPDLELGVHPVTMQLLDPGAVELWSPTTPRLYTVAVTLERDGVTLHRRTVRIGFREARFERSGFFLNGERLQLFGLNRHQLYPYTGGAMPARVQRRDAQILREELNCTMVRCSHYPQHESFLDACDELGLLVWDEPPGWQYLGQGGWLDRAHRDVREMVLRSRNHPSIVMWAARLNETPDNTEFYTRTQNLVRSLDDSRPTTGAILGSYHDTQAFEQDVFGYNDYSVSVSPDGVRQPELAPPRTEFPYLVSEAVGTLSGPARFYRRTDTQPVQQGQALAHARVHDLALRDPRYCGVLPWAGFDYPSGQGNIFDGIKWPGVVDLFRIPKPGAAMYRAQVDPAVRPVIEPSFYWDFHPTSPVGTLGAKAAIWSNLDRLEVFVGDRRHASLLPDRTDFPRLGWPPFYADFSTVDGSDAPALRIEGYLGERRVLIRDFSSDRSRDLLSLTLDDAVISADGVDTTRAEIRAVDEHGNQRTHVGDPVSFEIDGPADLIGDNPFPLADTGGAGAMWLRSRPDQTGTVHVTATHQTLGIAVVTLTVE